MTEVEKAIAAAEARHKELVAEMEKPETYADNNAAFRLNRELVEHTDRLDKLNEDWEDASAELAALNPKPEAAGA